MLHVDSPFNKKMKVILASLIITEVAEDNRLLIEKVRIFTIFQTINIHEYFS